MRIHSRVELANTQPCELAMSDEEIGRLAAHCALANGGDYPAGVVPLSSGILMCAPAPIGCQWRRRRP
jgi:hypothetical protein